MRTLKNNILTRRAIAIAIAFVMVFSLMPVQAFADINEYDVIDSALGDESYPTEDQPTEYTYEDDSSYTKKDVSPEESNEAEEEYEEYKEYEEYEEYELEINKEPVVTNYTVAIVFEEEYLVVERGSEFDLLYGVSAADQYGVNIPVFVLDDGGFDIYAEWPDNNFVITYAAIHPVTEQQFTAERIAFVTQPFVALGTPVSVSTWADLQAEINSATAPTTIELTGNIELTAVTADNAITIPAGTDITLTGGYTVLRTGGDNQRHFLVDGTLRLENITLRGNYPYLTNNHGGIEVRTGGHLIMEVGSVIRNNRNTGNTSAGAVFVAGSNAKFTMNGGEISHNSTPNMNVASSTGSATIFVNNNGVFTMNGGVIRNNTGRFGGGVRIGQTVAVGGNNRMYMHGGEIYGNTAFFGGGVNLEFGTFTMTAGTIRNNTATGRENAVLTTTLSDGRGGGGVFIQNSGIFNMSGGTISGNLSHTHGGGVMSGTPAANQFNMTGGTIRDNKAYNPDTNPFTTATNTGGGVRMTNGLFTMSSGTLDDGTITYGTITGNTATNDGGG
ncbi:MAG: hypothetical protein FWE92_01860, partial [Defluviitaleaceae bacterium]|nr:hypothetical protein [Defluviitaleaceae bacterium]